MYYVDRFTEWFGALGVVGKSVVAAVLGVAFGVGGTLTGGLLLYVVLLALLVDYLTDDVLDLHG